MKLPDAQQLIEGILIECQSRLTCVAMYANEAVETRTIPCIQALPDLVDLTSFSTELGDVKICLYVYTLRDK